MENAPAPVPPAPVQRDNSWRSHLRGTLVLGLPLIGAQLAQSAIGVTDTLMMGWLGVEKLAGGVLAAQMHFVIWIFGAGFALAIIPLAANAQGANDERGVRRSMRMGMWAVSFFFCLSLVPMWFARDIMLALGQKPEIANIVEQYIRIAMWAALPQLLAFCLRSLLTVFEFAKVILWSSIATAVLNALLNYMFMFGNFGAPEMGVRGAAVGTLLTQSIIFFALLVYTVNKDEIAKYDMFSRIWRADWGAFFETLRLGWPISFGILAEVSLFIGASVMMGWISTVALAAHGIALQLASVTFMIPLALSNAATVRVGKALGRKDWLGLERAGYSVLAIAVGIAFFAALIFWTFPEPLIRLFLDVDMEDTRAVITYAIPLVYIAAAFQLADSAQAIAVGNLRGMRDAKIPMMLAVCCYWLIGLPTGYVLAFHFNMEGIGLWIGLATALSLAAILLNGRFILRRKFELIPQ